LFASEVVALPYPLVAGGAVLHLDFPEVSRIQGCLRSSGKRGLPVKNQHVLVVREPRSKGIVLFLEPHKLGFQVANALLETTHFGDHAGIGTADVTE
jgi:hypothetical protein